MDAISSSTPRIPPSPTTTTQDNGSFSFDGQTVNPNATAADLNKAMMQEIQGQNGPDPTALGLTYNAGGLVFNDQGQVVGIDSSAQQASDSSTQPVQAQDQADSFQQRDFDKEKAQKLAALRAA